MAIDVAFPDEVLTIFCEVDISRNVAHAACQNACVFGRFWHNLL